MTKAYIKQLNDMQSLVKKMNNEGICNAECQKRKKIEKLRTNYMKAKNNLHNAQPEYDLAEKQYITEKHGASYYQSNIQESKFKKEAEAEVKGWDEIVMPIFNKVTTQLKFYKSQYYYKNNVGYLYDTYRDDLDNLYKKIDDTQGKNNVNDRLGQFYTERSDTIKNVTSYLRYLYWICYIVIIVLFIFKKQYKNPKFYPYIVTMGIMPFILSKFYVFVMTRFRYFIIDNIYFIFFVTIVILFGLLQFVSKMPFEINNPE